MDYFFVKDGVSFSGGQSQFDYWTENGWTAYKIKVESEDGTILTMQEAIASSFNIENVVEVANKEDK